MYFYNNKQTCQNTRLPNLQAAITCPTPCTLPLFKALNSRKPPFDSLDMVYNLLISKLPILVVNGVPHVILCHSTKLQPILLKHLGDIRVCDETVHDSFKDYRAHAQLVFTYSRCFELDLYIFFG